MVHHRYNRFFDWLSPFFGPLIGRPAAARRRALLNLSNGSLLMDTDGSNGRVSQYLAAPGIKVVVCDRNRSKLRQSRRRKT